MWASFGHAGMLDSTVESMAYKLMKQGLTASGKSEETAECVVGFLKWQGATDDVTDIRNILQPEHLVDELKKKADIAEFVCSPRGFFVIFLVILFILSCCCACAKRSSKPIIIIRPDPLNQRVPYEKV